MEKKIKPLFKYIGGKSWLSHQLNQKVVFALNNGKSINSYCEPFCGGLGSFLAVKDTLYSNKINKIHLSDINQTLIFIYQSIKENHDLLIAEIIDIEEKFKKNIPGDKLDFLNKNEIKKHLIGGQKYFEKIKKEFNQNKFSTPNIQQAARMIFLQKHSFNGIYRENSGGYYNTPFNWSPSDLSLVIETKIKEMKKTFDDFDIRFSSLSYQDIQYSKNTLYYLDPPYYNEKETENKYHKEHFGLNQQIDLIKRLKGKNFIYSNHYNETLLNELENKNFTFDIIERKNIMSPKNETRKTPKKEILGVNIVKD